jgi:Ca2+-transporting ATPase
MTYPYNHLLRGCSIIDGHCVAKVFAIGDSTEYGKVYVASKIESAIKTPLDQQLEKLGNLITKLSYAVAVLIVVGRMLIYFMGGEHLPFDWAHFATYLLNTFMLAVTLIVVAVPEGLPMSVTLSLALSMQRMLATNNLVRKIHACETMGATTVICTDKTGTLTMNQMRVAQMEMWTEKYSFIDGLAVNSTAHLKKEENGSYTVLGNPTEGALLLWSTGQGADIEAVRGANEIIDQIPFSPVQTDDFYIRVISQRIQYLFIELCRFCRRFKVNGNRNMEGIFIFREPFILDQIKRSLFDNNLIFSIAYRHSFFPVQCFMVSAEFLRFVA